MYGKPRRGQFANKITFQVGRWQSLCKEFRAMCLIIGVRSIFSGMFKYDFRVLLAAHAIRLSRVRIPSSPPGWFFMKLVTSHTCPFTTTQQSLLLEWMNTSVALMPFCASIWKIQQAACRLIGKLGKEWQNENCIWAKIPRQAPCITRATPRAMLLHRLRP